MLSNKCTTKCAHTWLPLHYCFFNLAVNPALIWRMPKEEITFLPHSYCCILIHLRVMCNLHHHLKRFWIWQYEPLLVFHLTFNLLGLETLSFANQLGSIAAGSCLIILAPFLTALWSCGFKTDKWNFALWYRIKWESQPRDWNNGVRLTDWSERKLQKPFPYLAEAVMQRSLSDKCWQYHHKGHANKQSQQRLLVIKYTN